MQKYKKALGPILTGLLIDLIDFATFGPLGIYTGFILGGMAAYILCILQNVPRQQSSLIALAAGIYCMTPLTELLPVGTLLGVYFALKKTNV